ncbi:hypothetical protein ACFLXE_06805 [Chloroflexota bacterium]
MADSDTESCYRKVTSMAKKHRKRKKLTTGGEQAGFWPQAAEQETDEVVQHGLQSIPEDQIAAAEEPAGPLVPAQNHSGEVDTQPERMPGVGGERRDREMLRWLVCGGGNLHIVAPCPSCHGTQGGLLLGTVAIAFRGVARVGCADCNEVVDYYVEASQGQIWRLDEQEVRM